VGAKVAFALRAMRETCVRGLGIVLYVGIVQEGLMMQMVERKLLIDEVSTQREHREVRYCKADDSRHVPRTPGRLGKVPNVVQHCPMDGNMRGRT
jgi:hypothetical protein